MKLCILHHKNKLLSKLKKQKLRHLEQQMAQHEKRKKKLEAEQPEHGSPTYNQNQT